ncbi:(deoxy)nucleoside triphosphate pyrophosphohydrolase [Agromyces sp. NPDC058126]|uniref:(deoxy)nucleoside triphosphate pyrophosphohydrolase n=1 Tax=Agromyces sp. NPDC058126 TaxID=3346350 RepID=UPI0036DA26FF
MTSALRVVAAAVVHDGLTLACRRASGRAAAGKWEFPGGKVEPGEGPRVALVRELREELGIEVEILELIDRSSTRVGEVTIDLSTYAARLRTRRPEQSTDHDLLGWFTPAELPQLDWAAPDLPAVSALSGKEVH